MSPAPPDDDAVSIVTLDAGNPLFAHVKAVRQAVFIDEQKVPPEEEWDTRDATALHLLATVRGEAAGTLRLYDDGGWLHLGRVAVLREYRSLGLGRLLVERGLGERGRFSLARAFLDAQSDKVGFYERFGFRAVGGEFMDAGIPHRRMEFHWGV